MAEIGKLFVSIGSTFDSKGFQKARAGVNKLGIGLAALGAAATVVGLKVAKAAGIQEQAELTLAQAMKQAGTFTQAAFQHNLNYAASLQKVTTYGDEMILGVQRMLTNFGIEGEALDGLTKATLDLAAAKGMDLKAAGDLVAKSVGSSTNALTRYGIEVTGAVGSTERAQMAVENISKLFGGAAAALADTYLGRVEQLSNQWGDLQEKIGTAVIPILLKLMGFIKTSVLPPLEKWFSNTKNIEKTTSTLTTGLKFFIKIGIGVTATVKLITAAIKVASAAQNILALRLLQGQAILTGNIAKFKEYGAQAAAQSDLVKTKIQEFNEILLESAEVIKEVDRVELESFVAKEEGKTAVIEEQLTAREALLEEAQTLMDERLDEAQNNQRNRLEVMDQIKADMDKRSKEREEDAEKRAEDISDKVAKRTIEALEKIADVEILTWKSGAKAFKEFMKQRLRDFVLAQIQELIAAKVKALAVAIFNSSITFGAAAGQIAMVLGAFAAGAE